MSIGVRSECSLVLPNQVPGHNLPAGYLGD